MTSIQDIGWGSYKEFSGPVYFGGRTKMPAPPSNTTENHRTVYIMTQTEGGSFSAVNMYDRCVVSTGIFQYCEGGLFLTSRLLGALADHDFSLLDPLSPALVASNAEFKRNANGKWRFFFKDARGEVDSLEEQRQLFLLNSDGKTWDSDNGASKYHAKLWAACLASVLEQPAAMDIQVDFCADRVMGFATPDAKAALFDPSLPWTGWTGALRTVYLSFAGNLPAVADKQLKIALASATAAKWSKDWCIAIMKQLAFGPQIAIFPGRYEKVRPLVETYYGVDMPDFASDLKAWRADMGISQTDVTFESTEDVQKLLVELGFDLGPKGPDGIMGPKTRDALIVFQRQNGLDPDGMVGPKTRAKLHEVWMRLHPTS